MKTFFRTAGIGAATVIALSMLAMPAQAKMKVKEIKFHWVTNQFGGPPVMVMKYTGSKWRWDNAGDYFKVGAKMKFKTNNKTGGWAIHARHIGTVYMAPASYRTKKFEKLVTIGFSKKHLQSYSGGAAGVCKTFGSTKKVIRDMSIFTSFQVAGKVKKANLPLRIVCMPRGPQRS